METQKLSALLTVIQCGSITKASQVLGYTQSGLSHQIKALERELGFSVFVRSKAGVEPTAACQKLLPALRETVRWSRELEKVSASIRGVMTGKICIGSFTSLSVHWLPQVIRAFEAQYPQVELTLKDGGGEGMAEALENGQIDVGFGCRPQGGKTTWCPLFEDQLMVVAPADWDLGSTFPLQRFHGAAFIALPDDFDREVPALFQRYSVVPNVKFCATDDYTIISMVEQGLGMSILPELLLRGYRHCRIQTAPLDPVCHRELGIILPAERELSPATKKFIACAKRIPLSRQTDETKNIANITEETTL